MDHEVLTVEDVGGLPVSVVAEPAALLKYLSVFHSGTEEVAMSAHPRASSGGGGGGGANGAAVEIRSYADPHKGLPDNSLQSSLTLYNTLTFVSYRNSLGKSYFLLSGIVGSKLTEETSFSTIFSDHSVEIVYNIKDFKAMLTLAEQMGSQVELTFREPRQPLLVATHYPPGHMPALRARLVLSTIDNSWDTGATQADIAGQLPPVAAPQQQQQPAPSQPMPAAFEGKRVEVRVNYNSHRSKRAVLLSADVDDEWAIGGMEE